ncbi:Fe2+-enterobactin ABC transporter substrate-binding protein [Microbacterium indicum]|uniref:Fe2+-enterobactin ABC transporter substrate-binding protein n=1 Tax=Microbacterium indicum TaxID=358100 RepID=UPI0005681F5B|nr:Fe2+-enterobactin ABC transporter substrate-binding protein [Microbacterium indicum]
MPTISHTLRRGLVVVAVAAAASASLAACSSDATDASAETPAASAGAGDWPRSFENADGTTTEIPAQPESILSTSVTVTGTLLAIDAPVTSSASAGNGEFFAQWADVADERGVDNIWAVGSPDIEAAIAAAPDLIVVSSSGADSMTDQVSDLEEIAPVIIVDYGEQTWQDLAVELGEATGLEDAATQAADDFDALVAETAGEITVPEGEANIVSYNGEGQNNPIGLSTGPQGQLLESLGFTIEDPDPAWSTQAGERSDFVFADYEHLTELTADTTFVLSADDEAAKSGFAADAVLANLPSVANGQVYGLGLNSFRIDLYSATEIVEHIADDFGA